MFSLQNFRRADTFMEKRPNEKFTFFRIVDHFQRC